MTDPTRTTLTLPASKLKVGDVITHSGAAIYEIGPSVTEPGNIMVASGSDGKVSAMVYQPWDLVTVTRQVS